MTTGYGDPKARPSQGDAVAANLTIRVGHSNGDFREVTFVDHLDRPLGRGSIPYRALREIRDHEKSS